MTEIAYSAEALYYFEDLIILLFKKEYFSFEDTCIDYVRDIRSFIKTNIDIAPKKQAPPRFSRIAPNLQYIIYKRNNRTSWFIFFTRKDNRYLIEHITNNHAAAQHVRGL